MSEINNLLIVTAEDKRRVRELYKKTEEDIKNDLTILLEWLNKQPHLPKPHDANRLESSLLRNKFRIEQTKAKLDKYYTYRGIYTDFFVNLNPECVAIENVRKSVFWVPMPKLLPTAERVLIAKFVEKNEAIFNVKDFFTYVLMMLDLQLTHDYAVADRYVVDTSNMSLKYVLKMEPNVVSKGFFLNQQAFSGRISHIEYINLPPAIEAFMKLIKQLVDAKLFAKIRTHKNLASLYDVFPREYLPKEYGGDQESLYSLHDKWGKELILQKEFLEENAKRISNENLRIGKPIHNELFGLDGTFKKINLD